MLWVVGRGSCGLLRIKMARGGKLQIHGRLIKQPISNLILKHLRNLFLRLGCPMAPEGQAARANDIQQFWYNYTMSSIVSAEKVKQFVVISKEATIGTILILIRTWCPVRDCDGNIDIAPLISEIKTQTVLQIVIFWLGNKDTWGFDNNNALWVFISLFRKLNIFFSN